MAVENAVDGRRQRQRLQPLEVAVGELRALPVLGQVLAVAPQHVRVERPDERDRLARIRAVEVVAAENDRVGVDLGQHGLERPRHPVDVVERGDSSFAGIGDLDEHAPSLAHGARAHERPQRAHDPPCRPITLPTSSAATCRHEHERAVALLRVHAHGLWIVDELAREIREQFRHYARYSRCPGS